MTALGPTGKMVKTSPPHQIGTKDLNILMMGSVAVTQDTVVASKGIKVNSLNPSLVEANIAKVDGVGKVVRA